MWCMWRLIVASVNIVCCQCEYWSLIVAHAGGNNIMQAAVAESHVTPHANNANDVNQSPQLVS